MAMLTTTGELIQNALYFTGKGGYPAGNFTNKLFQAINAADNWNKSKLESAFPEEFAALKLAQLSVQNYNEAIHIADGYGISVI